MSVETGRACREGVAFVDSNILVYAHDTSAGRKREVARALLEELWRQHSGRLSIQVLQEFFVISPARARARLALQNALRTRAYATCSIPAAHFLCCRAQRRGV